ncbi:MAG TPA: T9SS type A sorting domain-containing protein [Bacteroidales bacterium]|nr:T9SS type A sorting domain-containing protein [Bacteroidales bacterium]HPS18278.1 T9SS type A sorting domain-containing protein [Bacteroidales bacterium]
MKKILFFLTAILIFINFQTFSQYLIGHQAITYIDSARSNRSVATHVYYPATSAGETTPIASGQFPVIVFGHGFAMTYDAYMYFKDTMTTRGYIVVFPTTESSWTSPSHTNFGLDFAFLVNKMKMEGNTPASLFYGHIAPQSAIMGHSMGGGSSFLGCQNNTVPTCMVTFAAATTNPSSITAAKYVTIPALVVSGSADCVAGPSTNQQPMYDSLASNCKFFLSITGGGHCYFGDNSTTCNLGETTCSHPLSREAQHDVVLDFVKLYLDYYLKNNASSWNVFNDSLNASPRITHHILCTTTGIDEIKNNSVSIYPNPASDEINISFFSNGNTFVKIFDITGNVILSEQIKPASGVTIKTMDVKKLSKGIYFIELSSSNFKVYKKFIKS